MERQNETLQKYLGIVRYAAVYVFLIFLMLLNASSLPVFDIGNITPYFLLMGIYFWLLTRPGLLPFYLVFIFGLGLDFITGQVVGLNAFSFLMISFVLTSQRRYMNGQAWPVIWAGFGFAALFLGAMHMLIFILMNWAWPGIFELFATVLISVLAYPLMTLPMSALNKLFR